MQVKTILDKIDNACRYDEASSHSALPNTLWKEQQLNCMCPTSFEFCYSLNKVSFRSEGPPSFFFCLLVVDNSEG